MLPTAQPDADPQPGDGSTALPDSGPNRILSGSGSGSWGGEKGRFVPGTLIGGRFRIVALLGRGGMGEIYRAEDLRLDQSVALKFLTQQYAHDSGRLTRLLQEVRLAREITHPCVSRIHDFFDVDGHCFVSMEYVDGENLSVLLRRIGRLPQTKALETAHQVIAGLAAAHEKGILHRDLKPENIMIDGRGQAHLMDFGIASLREGGTAPKEGSALAGTPAYMAPELLKGKSPSEQSDLYALGILLFELFTGQKPFQAKDLSECVRMHLEALPPPPANLVRDLDPEISQAILHCLEKDPEQRPASARALAGELPGGDPLANAIAAGMTPAPEVVAEAEVKELAPLKYLWGLLILALAGLGAYAFLAPRASLMGYLPSARPAVVLADRAQQILEGAGWSSPSGSVQYRFQSNSPLLLRMVREGGASPRWDSLDQGISPLTFHYYRIRDPWRGPRWPSTSVDRVTLDHRGHLVLLSVTPWKFDAKPDALPDWAWLFREAGLDISTFTATSSLPLSGKSGDQRVSWVSNQGATRVEGTAFEGRPVSFFVSEEARTSATLDQAITRKYRFGNDLLGVFYAIPILLAAVLARVHLRSGRADRQGAMRLAIFSFSARLLVSLLTEWGHFTWAGILESLSLFLAPAILWGAITWVLYLAAEPTMRRHWPLSLVAWVRLLSGRWRDPLVGRDLLSGVCVGAVVASLLALLRAYPLPGGILPLFLFFPYPESLISVSGTFAIMIRTLVASAAMGLGILLAAVLVWRLVRLRWLALLIVYLAVLLPYSIMLGTSPLIFLLVHGIIFALPMMLLRRAGLLAFAVFFFAMTTLTWVVGTRDWSSWTGTHSLVAMGTLLGLVLWGFHRAVGGRPLFGKGFLA